MSEWSFQRKLTSGVVGICLLAILTSAATLFTARILISNMANLSTEEGRDVADAKALQLAGARNIADAQACLLSGGVSFAREAEAGAAGVRDQALDLKVRLASPGAQVRVTGVLDAARAHDEAFDAALQAMRASSAQAKALYPEPVLTSAAELDRALAALVSHLQAEWQASLVPARASVSRAEILLMAVTTATILLLVILCLLIVGVLGRSYRKQAAARTLAEHGQTAARASLSAVEEASHMKDEFLATVSHELRNPLAPILTWTQLLRSGTLDEAKTRRALEVIQRNVISQAQLIDDLVDVSRVVSGKFRLDVRPVELAPVIRAAAESQAPASDAKHIRMQMVLDDRAGMISGDSERLQQVMWNLISNAIKFTPKGGRVQVVLQRAESHVEIVVSDSGVGIEPEFLPHVFEPFRQGSVGPMRRHGGLGLGLSIVRHIVELHGGEINAESDGLDRGSRFTVKFPLLATGREAPAPIQRHPIARDTLADLHLGRLDDVRVLIVDDEPSASEALLVLLQSCGADARTAGDVPGALEILESWRPDVIVSDIAMPGEDGYGLIRRIRSLSPEHGGLIPAVALTAYAKIEDRVTILEAGFQMYLSKPADPNELVAVVGSLARHRGPRVERVPS